jgi:hypothetical protein
MDRQNTNHPPNGPCCQCVTLAKSVLCISILIVCMSRSHSQVHACSNSSSLSNTTHDRISHPPSFSPCRSTVKQANGSARPSRRQMPRAISRDEKRERSVGLGRCWDFVCAQASAFHESNEGGVSTVCESPTAHCVLASIVMRS